MEQERQMEDFELWYGVTFQTQFTVYNDPTAKRWRGTYDEQWLYRVGDACRLPNGPAFVAKLEGQHDEPGSPGASPFWTPMAVQNLTGYTTKLVCGTTFTEEGPPSLVIEPLLGIIKVELAPTVFATAPASSHYYLELIDPLSRPTSPFEGTMVFKSR